MKNVMQYLKENYKLNENDQEICRYILKNIEEIPYLSSRELARRTYTNPTTLLRLSKKLGFENYNDLKINFGSFIKQLTIHNDEVINKKDILSTMENLTNLQINIIKQTKELLDLKEFYSIIHLLEKTAYIDIIADDANSDIAEYASHNFCIVNKTVTVYKNPDKQLYLGLNVRNDHVVIIMSKHNLNKQIQNTAKLLKRRKIPTIAITTDKTNILSKSCTYSLLCAFDPSISKLGDMIFNVSSKYLFDLIFSILFSENYDETLELERIHKNLYLHGINN